MIKKYLLDIFFWILAVFTLLFNNSKDGVFFLDVGQGDAVLIQKDDVQILIDGGEDNSVLYQMGKYMPFGDMKIELVVLTHPHSDHLNGLFYIFERYEIEEVWYNDIDYKSEIYEYFLELDIPREEAKEGTIYYIDTWRMEVLSVPDEIYEKDSNVNNSSIALQLNTGNNTFLFMGDAETEEEEYLIQESVLEDIDILKAGHHCSRTASSDNFLNIVKPQIAICSYGKDNKFGHPHRETLDKLKARNIRIHSTAEEGNIWVL